MNRIVTFLILAFLFAQNASAKPNQLWPHPQAVTMLDDYLLIQDPAHFRIITESKCDLIVDAIDRYIKTRFFIQDCSKLNPSFHGKYFLPHRINHMKDPHYKGSLQNVTLKIDGGCEHYPSMEMNEKYSISIKDKQATIHGESVWGALRGLETFSQLLRNTGRDEFAVNLAEIHDYPRFAHRGLLIDSSRHFLSLHNIRQTIDAMEMNKLNVLHWHIVDDQSFPYVSDAFPDLSKLGSYDPNDAIYTSKNIADIIEYARRRAIRVLPEFDSPGHTQSWGRGQKDLLTECYFFGTEKPNGYYGPIDPTKDSAYPFIRKLFAEVTQRFPDQYLHLGGDEVDTSCWRSNPKIAEFMRKHKMAGDYDKLEAYYIQRVVDIVKELKKSYIVWQEVFDNHVTLKQDTVVHVWISPWTEEIGRVTKAGYHTLLSAPWYLDQISWGQDWIKYYEADPFHFNGTDAQKALILGGEACIWGELVNGANLISRTWPRASAVAERLWSSASVNDTKAARPRFHEMECRMQRNGFAVHPADGPGYCPCDYAF